MMIKNGVTHTLISKAVEAYKVSVLSDYCTSTDKMNH